MRFWGKLILVLASSVAGSGCATTAKYKAKLDSWMGEDANRLLRSWGPPSESHRLPNGETQYVWMEVGGTYTTTTYLEFTNQLATSSVTYWCKTTMTVGNTGRVSHWSYKGNACRSR
jgi:hypothetical protein